MSQLERLARRCEEIEAIITKLTDSVQVDEIREVVEDLDLDELYCVVVMARRALYDQPDESWDEVV
jgi:hypothetical protein